MVSDYALEMISGVADRNYICPIFFWNLPTFTCFLPYFLGLPVPTFSLLLAGKTVEGLPIFLEYGNLFFEVFFLGFLSSSLLSNPNLYKLLIILEKMSKM